jgi:hypothetical protein
VIVEYRAELADALPENRRRFMNQLRLTPGRRYEVHGVSVFDQMVFVLVVDDIDTDAFCLAAAFRVVDGSIPQGWVCTPSDGVVQFVLGPPFLAASVETYNTFLDRGDREQLNEFWRYLDARRRIDTHDDVEE